VARRRDNLAALAGEIEHQGGQAAFAPADVADQSVEQGALVDPAA